MRPFKIKTAGCGGGQAKLLDNFRLFCYTKIVSERQTRKDEKEK
jgi:hypothetical protein